MGLRHRELGEAEEAIPTLDEGVRGTAVVPVARPAASAP